MVKSRRRPTAAPTTAFIVAISAILLLLGGTVATLHVQGAPRIEPIRPPIEFAPGGARRLTVEDLIYQGAFRVPAEANGDSISYGGQVLAYNPAAKTLFISSRNAKVAEISIPAPVRASRLDELPIATYLQPFRDPADGRLRDISNNEVVLGGLLVHDGRLYGTGLIYYDASHNQRLTHFSRSLDLSRPEVQRIYQVGETGKAGFVAGYMASVPTEWRTALGGPAVTGQCCIPIIGRTSWGPGLFSWNPADLGRRDPAPAVPLLYYTEQHATLGSWQGSSITFGGTTEVAGVAIIDGTRTILFAGRTGTGEFCYGTGTDDPVRARQRGANGEIYCFDPTSNHKGSHAYPYRLQFWAYDVMDIADVRAGNKQPWDVKPYAVWPFELPSLGDPQPQLGRLSYDAAGRRLFISELFAERDAFARRPLIHVYSVRR